MCQGRGYVFGYIQCKQTATVCVFESPLHSEVKEGGMKTTYPTSQCESFEIWQAFIRCQLALTQWINKINEIEDYIENSKNETRKIIYGTEEKKN